MKLLVNEYRKLQGAKWLTALLAALLFASAVLCFFYVSNGERAAYSTKEVEMIRSFTERYKDDPDGLEAFKSACLDARAAIFKRIGEEYQKELDAGGNAEELDKKYEKIYTDPATFRTNLFDAQIDDASLIPAYEKLAAVKEDYDLGQALILTQARRNADELRKEYGMTPDDALYQYQIYVYEKYTAVSENAVVGDTFVSGWDRLFFFTYGDIFLFTALLLFAGSIFFVERQNGMTLLLRVSKKGRAQLACAKVGAAALFSVLLTLLFTLLSFVVIGLRCGYSDPTVSVQNIPGLALFSENFSILGFFLYMLAVKVLAALAFSTLLALLASVLPSMALYLLSGGAVYGATFLASRADAAAYPFLRGLNIFSICNFIPIAERLYVFQPFVSCIGYHFLAPILCALLFLVAGAATVILSACLRGAQKSERKECALLSRLRAFLGRGVPVFDKKRAYKISLVRWELRKTVGKASALLLILLLLAAQIGVSVYTRYQSEATREQKICTRFILLDVQGAFSQNGRRFEALLKIYTDPQNGLAALASAVSSGVFDAAERVRIENNARFIYEYELNDDLGYAESLYRRLEEQYANGLDPDVIDETGAAPLLTGSASYPLYAAILLLCIGAWTMEYAGKSAEDQFARILFSTGRGRRPTFFSKIAAALLFSTALALLFGVTELLILTPGRNFDCLTAPLYSLEAYANAGIGMPVGAYLLFVLLARIAAADLLALFALAVAALTKNFSAAFGIVSGVTLIPTLLRIAGFDATGYLSFGDFFGVNGMVLFLVQKQIRNAFGYFILFAAAFISITIFLFFTARRKLFAIKRKEKRYETHV